MILLELTCCAEEGIEGAQVRKEARYAELLTQIEEQKWTATLLTLEIGARGLVGSRTFRSFVVLGFSVRSANTLCKSLSDIASRCSYGIYLAHSTTVWPHNNDLVVGRSARAQAEDQPLTFAQKKLEPNIVTLRQHGITKLFHFTDASNVASIKQHGLMSASSLIESSISSTMNSDEASRSLDASANLENFVRLSFCSKNPMMYVAYKEGRISKPTLLEIKLEVVSRPGVQFSDSNANRLDARLSTNPSIVRFDVVNAKSAYDVEPELRRFYQAEILVPSPLPAHLITVRRRPVRMPKRATLELLVSANDSDPTAVKHKSMTAKNASAEGGDLSSSGLSTTESAVSGEARRSSKSSSTSVSTSTPVSTSSPSCNIKLADGGAATSSTSPPVRVLDNSATGLVTKFNGADAQAAKPCSVCFGFEHEPQDYCSSASVDTWVLRREPVEPRSASAPDRGRTGPASPVLVRPRATVRSQRKSAKSTAVMKVGASVPFEARTARCPKPNVPAAAVTVSPSASVPATYTARRESSKAVSPSASVPSTAHTARRVKKSTVPVLMSASVPDQVHTARSVEKSSAAADCSSASAPDEARTARSLCVKTVAAVSPSASVCSTAHIARGVKPDCSSASVPDQACTARRVCDACPRCCRCLSECEGAN